MSFFLSSSTIVSSKLSSNNNQHDPSSSPTRNKNEMKFAKMALVALVAGALTLGSVHDEALAAKSGGRIGGQAFRSSAPRPSAPRSSGPRINNSRTNIYINPGIAPPLGGYGYGGYAVPYYGGYGFSPFSLIGFGGGFELFGLALFLGAAAAVVRRFTGSSRNDDEDDY